MTDVLAAPFVVTVVRMVLVRLGEFIGATSMIVMLADMEAYAIASMSGDALISLLKHANTGRQRTVVMFWV